MRKFDRKSCKIYAKYDGKQKRQKKKDFCWKKKLLGKSFFIWETICEIRLVTMRGGSVMWNWKEFYQIIEQIGKYTRVLCSGESFVQIPQKESIGTPYLLHTISGRYYHCKENSFFCNYDIHQITANKLIWFYLKRIPGTKEILFNTVFLRHGRKRQKKPVQEQHGIHMVYRRIGKEQAAEQGGMEKFCIDGKFKKLVIIGQKDIEMRKATIAELLEIFGRAVNEDGMMLLFEQNARIIYQEIEEKININDLEIETTAAALL